MVSDKTMCVARHLDKASTNTDVRAHVQYQSTAVCEIAQSKNFSILAQELAPGTDMTSNCSMSQHFCVCIRGMALGVRPFRKILRLVNVRTLFWGGVLPRMTLLLPPGITGPKIRQNKNRLIDIIFG